MFGPVLSVLRYGDDDDAVRIANNSQYGLSGAVWGTDVDRAVAVARRIRTGQIAVNGFGPGGAPFGGFKQSGFGRERRDHWDSSVHGAEGHGTAGVTRADDEDAGASRDCGGTARLRGRVAHMTGALDGLRVVEIADEISGPYCGKLFVDLGAEVTKIEAPEGDSLRQWGPFPGHEPDPNRSGLFEYLNAGKRGTVLDVTCEGDVAAARQLIGDADVLIDASILGTLDKSVLGVEVLQHINPRLVVVRISNFGQHGPFRDRAATSLTMQAVSGWISARDPDRPPVQAGARIAEYVAGAYAALGALTALRIAPTGRVTEVDVSVLEALLSTLPYPMLLAERMRTLGLPSNIRSGPMLGVVRAADGWVGINCLTGQHWLDVCAMLGLAEFGEQQFAIMMGGPERGEFFAAAEPWLSERTVAEIVELSQALRIPAAPVADGASALECPQYAKRGFFVDGGTDDWSFSASGAAVSSLEDTGAARPPRAASG